MRWFGRRGNVVTKRKRYAAEEIIGKLREAEVHLAQGLPVGQAVRKLGSASRRTTAGVASTAGCASTRRSG